MSKEDAQAALRPSLDTLWECLPDGCRPGQGYGTLPVHGFDIPAVLRATDITILIAEAVDLRKAGHDFQARCPFHDEKTPSFTVSQTKQFYHCFGCGIHGDALDWMQQYHRMTFHQALTALAGRAGIQAELQDPAEACRRRAVAHHAQIEASAWIELAILQAIIGERVTYRAMAPHTRDRYPHLKAPPDGPDDRELLAAQRLSNALSALYGVFPGRDIQSADESATGRKTAAQKAAEREAWLRGRRLS